ncbi:MAG: hypothetical protein Q4D24_12965 [Erysipelotrichaceae bacterium]|nr:hypothetical protein [Erysipelotrichaceae bacterium]
MNNKLNGYFTTVKKVCFICLTVLFLCSCSAGNSSTKEEANSSLLGTTKEVEIYDIIFTLPENWFVEENEDMTFLYCQDEKSDEAHDANNGIIILNAKDRLENTKDWEDAEWYLSQVKDSLIEQKKIDKNYTEESFEKKETPVLLLRGKYPDTNINTAIYLMMSDYGELLLLQYVTDPNSGEKDYYNEVREIVDNLKFSYDGYKKATPHSGSSPSSKENCDGEPYGAGSDWAKYDKNGDGCINDSEFQNGMNDAIEDRLNNSTSDSSTSNRIGLCEFKENGRYVCNKKATSGMSYCQEHWKLLYDTYKSVGGH